MNDMRKVTEPKSDQWNFDDFQAGALTFSIEAVRVKGGQEQPVEITLAGTPKFYRPCKSMCRVLVSAWGPDSSKYVGRSLTLYGDQKVKWGGMEVGGIRISHMSDIADDMTMALTVTRANKKPFTVRPLIAEVADTEASLIKAIAEATGERELQDLAGRCINLDDPEARKRVVAAGKKRLKEIRPSKDDNLPDEAPL